MKSIKSIFLGVVYIVIFSLSLDATGKKDINWMINAVNHQKVLTQQILKEYAFKGMGHSYKDSSGKLEEYLIEYDEEVKELQKVLLKDTDAKKQLKDVIKIWVGVKEVFNSTPDKEKVEVLQKKVDKILGKMSRLMRTILSKSDKDISKMVSISGYQSVIIERMASLYMLKTWGVDDPKFNFKMKESMTFFTNSLYKMLDSKETSKENEKSIRKIMKYFKFFKVMNQSKKKYIPTLIYHKTSKIHSELDIVTKRYINKGK